jgi:NAD-dependent deacetylase
MTEEPTSLSLAADWLRSAREVVVFTGAGISAESGIPTFRDDGGFWRHFPVEEFATWKGLVRMALRQPGRLAEFLHAVLYPIATAMPNPGHRAIAELEKHVGVTVVTQNVDNLHQEAGSTSVHEVHGSLFEVVARRGRFVRLLSHGDLLRIAEALGRLRRGWLVLPRVLLAIRPMVGLGLRGLHFPRLVLFGDAMAEPAWSRALEAARRCDCVIQVGTSGTVMPAATLPMEAKAAGATIITIDPAGGEGDICLAGTAATVLPRLVGEAFNHPGGP